MAAPARLTATEYFKIDDAADTKHELVEGELYAMAGGTPAHARLPQAFGGILYAALRGTPCQTFSSDLRVAVQHDTYAYPDLTVVCGPLETHPESENTVTNPRLVLEVLSPSTERYDTGRKATLYRRIPSLTSIVLIASERREVETHERQADGSWVIRTYAGSGDVPLPSINARFSLDELYEGVL